MLVLCERWVGDGDRPQILLTTAALLLHSGWAAQPWVTEGPKPSVPRWLSLRHLVPNCNLNSNWVKPSVAPGYIFVWRAPASCGRTHLPPSPNSTTSTGQGDIPISSTGCTYFVVHPLIYTGASLDWRLGRGSICYKSINHLSPPSLLFFNKVGFGIKLSTKDNMLLVKETKSKPRIITFTPNSFLFKWYWSNAG